ncbi:MAG: phosphoribosylanthranilate isomerase, partial [Clostridia bacterium]|nr:phosphoribosylanthranilate isomerase [Clostridia bacterium]
DADYVNAAMPDYVGFVFYPKSHRYVKDAEALTLRRSIDKRIATVGVFVDEPREHMMSLCDAGVIDIIQLHGHETDDDIAAIRRERPGIEIWKAFKIRSAEDAEAAEKSKADRILLDNGYGTGERFEWSYLKGIGRPFILAGGLTCENIGEAIDNISPWGVDVSSGVETDGVKDSEKIRLITAAAKRR